MYRPVNREMILIILLLFIFSVNCNKYDKLICLLGHYQLQQFPIIHNRQSSHESHLESLANELFHHNISFIVITPKIIYHNNNITYPYSKSIYYTKSYEYLDSFIEDTRIIIESLDHKPDIIWSTGEWSAKQLSILHIPMIVTLPNIKQGHVYNDTIDSHIYYRFLHIKTYDHFLTTYPSLRDYCFICPIDHNEMNTLLDSTNKLLGSLINQSIVQGVKDMEVKDIPLIMIGREIYDIYNLSSQFKSNKSLIVGTMTTTPKRMNEVDGPFGLTVKTILSFSVIDRLYINIPYYYELRSKSGLVLIPDKLIQLSIEYNGRLRILRCKDYGPSTKLLPTLLLSNEDLPLDSMLITFDDDRIYTINAVNALISNAKIHPNTVITIAAWPINILSSDGKRGIAGGPNFRSKLDLNKVGIQYRKTGYVDLILGFFGVLYRKNMFYPYPKEIFDYNSSNDFKTYCSWVDDIWISGYLEYKQIPRWVVGKVPDSNADITKLSNVNALSLDEGESVKQNRDNVYCAEAMRKKYGVWK